MSGTDRKAGGPDAGWDFETKAIVAAVGAAVTFLVTTNVALRGAQLLGAPPQDLPSNPFVLAFGVLGAQYTWSTEATVVLATCAVAIIAAAAAARHARSKAPTPKRVDAALRHMASPKQYTRLLEPAARKKAERLGVMDSPGIPIARTIGRQSFWTRARIRGAMLYMSFEDVAVDIWGPRTGKTTARAVPAIVSAVGAVLATSNKRDIVDGTRGIRERVGRVWVFDPQAIIGEEPSWWWNPLSYVTDEVKAESLATVLISSNTDPNASKDAYFDSAGTELFQQLVLAAALGGRPITQLYEWLSKRQSTVEATEILYANGYRQLGAALAATLAYPEKQVAGLFGTAMNYCAFLKNRDAMRWVTPQGDDDRRPHFDPAAFVREDDDNGKQTLYSISKEGVGSTGAMVTALTVAVCEAAEKLATECGGRLPAPMTAVLDEAANVCRWRQLPDLYSHYGSRGICILTILQSWSQGVEVWGERGMNKLWSAANVKIYGGGVSEAAFLKDVSDLIGDYEQSTRSVSHGKGGDRNVQRSSRRDQIMDVSDLAAIDEGRIVVFSSQNPAVLAETAPWYEDDCPYKADVEASLAKYAPKAKTTPAIVAAPNDDSTPNPWMAAGSKA